MSTDCQPYPADPADLFIRLYDELDASCAADGRADAWLEEGRVQDIAELVEEAALEHGKFDPEATAEQFELAEDDQERRFAYLLGLDAAFAATHPATDAVDRGRMTELAVRFRIDGRLNSADADGALLPRYAWPGRLRAMDDPPTEEKADLFEYVTRVTPETWSTTVSARIPRELDFPASVRNEGLVVGCAPVATLRDVRISAFDGRRRYYRIEPLDSEALRSRIATIVGRLDAQGVEMAIMPELTLPQSLVAHWQEVLRDPPPRGSRLRFILIGTGPFDAREDGLTANRAVVLARDGTVLLEQDKRHPFTLTTSQIEDWGLTEHLGGSDPAAEPIVPGMSFGVLESSSGRISVMVCEDLGRLAQGGRRLVELGPSVLLAPVLSKPTLLHYWEHSDAKGWASEVGSNTVVANSLVIEECMREAGKLEPGELGTALAHSPTGEHAHGHTEDPGGVTSFRLSEEAVVRAVAIDREDVA